MKAVSRILSFVKYLSEKNIQVSSQYVFVNCCQITRYGCNIYPGRTPRQSQGSQQVLCISDGRQKLKRQKWDAIMCPDEQGEKIVKCLVQPSSTSIIGKWTVRIKTQLKSSGKCRWNTKEKSNKADGQDTSDNFIYILFNPFDKGKLGNDIQMDLWSGQYVLWI